MSQRRLSPQRRALLKLFYILLVASTCLVWVIVWAARNADSAFAAQVRQIIGLPHPAPATPVPELPEPVQVVEPEPVEHVPEPDPEPTRLTYADLVERRQMWPANLQLAVEKRFPVVFNGKNYGHLEFAPGEILRVESLFGSRQIRGRVNENHLNISVSQTNLEEWFEQEYGSDYILDLAEESKPAVDVSKLRHAVSREEILAEMRYWCYTTFGPSISFDIGEDSLVLKWLPNEDWPIDFRAEARAVARQYLVTQAAMGGKDNYAACEIRHPRTNELLGAGSVYILTLDN